jgi:ATP-binding cassette subfamily B (MDR/TAP) protein 1
MASWIYTGETTTRRIREGYLRAVLRQNVGFFDQLGAGEVTTRITSDIHLIQEGISEKVPITFQFVSQFFAGGSIRSQRTQDHLYMLTDTLRFPQVSW